ncbi:MAG: DUF805 domain-containing protein [Pseudomonadota bacterium]
MDWYLSVWEKYAVFDGRARRKEYWWFTLFNVLALLVLALIDSSMGSYSPTAKMGLLSGVYVLASILPSIGVTIRRLHDTDRSGWWMLISFIPVIGHIVLMVLLAIEGTQGDNRFGPNPKSEAEDDQLLG